MSQAMFFHKTHNVATGGQSSGCHLADASWMKLAGKKCLPKNVGRWVVTGVYWVLSRTGFSRTPLLAAACVVDELYRARDTQIELPILQCSRPPPTINSAQKVSIRTVPGSRQTSFFPTRARTCARQSGIERQL